eukprot:jgi/Galph1/2789/GphlegSOOS_G1487.1
MDTKTYRYGPTSGVLELQKKIGVSLQEKFSGTCGNEVMISAGSNQGFINILLCLCDPGDEVILFKPYYFSHYSACLLVGAKPVVLDTDSDFQPIPQNLQFNKKTKLVVVVNPGNPTGTVLSNDLLRSVYYRCFQSGVWLVIDEAYEHFLFDITGCSPFSAHDGVINLYTFSKTYSLAGLRVGYFAYPSYLRKRMLEIQDTIPTHACHLAQQAALAALELSSDWIQQQVNGTNLFLEEIFLGKQYTSMERNVRKEASFFWVPLPNWITSYRAMEYFAKEHGILTFPGSVFGIEHYLRISYGSLSLMECEEAACKVDKGLGNLFSNT